MQKVRVGINGFGRIGRQVFRALHAKYQDKVEVVAINDLFDAETNFHLLEYDTNYGRANLDAVVEGDRATVGEWTDHIASRSAIRKLLAWGACGVDVVVESTGIFRSAKQARVHLENGAKKVIITAPAKEAGPDRGAWASTTTTTIRPSHHVVSNASCTTNCLAPVALVCERVRHTAGQHGHRARLHQRPAHPGPAAQGPAPGARRRVQHHPHRHRGGARPWPRSSPRCKGTFQRVRPCACPRPTVSVVDFSAVLEQGRRHRHAAAAALRRDAAEGELRGHPRRTATAQLVSMDFKGDPRSSIVEAEYCERAGRQARPRLSAWYDNEWGYSNRVADLIMWMKEKGF